MRFEVPQFIEIEDKIFGPFTWKQGIYLGGGVGLAVVLFFVAPFYVTFILGIPIALLAAALAFYPVNSRPFSVLLESIWGYYKNSRQYHWRRQREVIYRSEESVINEANKQTAIPRVGDSGVNSLARKLELDLLAPPAEPGEKQ